MLDETVFGGTMALSVINKINNILKFLCQKNRFFTPTLRQLPLPQNQCRSNGIALHCSTIWSKTPDTIKRTKSIKMFKHNLKEHYLKELENFNSRELFILK